MLRIKKERRTVVRRGNEIVNVETLHLMSKLRSKLRVRMLLK